MGPHLGPWSAHFRGPWAFGALQPGPPGELRGGPGEPNNPPQGVPRGNLPVVPAFRRPTFEAVALFVINEIGPKHKDLVLPFSVLMNLSAYCDL